MTYNHSFSKMIALPITFWQAELIKTCSKQVGQEVI